jgi:hypothetical protein
VNTTQHETIFYLLLLAIMMRINVERQHGVVFKKIKKRLGRGTRNSGGFACYKKHNSGGFEVWFIPAFLGWWR